MMKQTMTMNIVCRMFSSVRESFGASAAVVASATPGVPPPPSSLYHKIIVQTAVAPHVHLRK